MNKINPNTFTLPDGKSYVVIAQSDYENLLDQLEAAELRVARLVNEGHAGLPADIVNPLAEGENPIRVFRKWRGMTGSELADKAGISQPYLSDIENGKRDGTLQTLVAIADALEVDLDDIAGWLVRNSD